MHTLLIRCCLIVMLVVGGDVLLADEARVLLDEEWDVELQMREVKVDTVRDLALEIPSGGVALRVRNQGGQPFFRLGNVGQIAARDIVPGVSRIRLYYRSDAYDGRIRVGLHTYHGRTHGKTFELATAALDGGGEGGKLVADNRWHLAEGALQPSEFLAQIGRAHV